MSLVLLTLQSEQALRIQGLPKHLEADQHSSQEAFLTWHEVRNLRAIPFLVFELEISGHLSSLSICLVPLNRAWE